MAEHKDQHYVPQVYLRQFSPDPEHRSLNMIRIPTMDVVPSVALKGQCQENHFYGKDLKLEKALGELEGHFGDLLRKFDNKEFFPANQTPERVHLLSHTMIQWARTKVSATRTADAAKLPYEIAFKDYLRKKAPEIPKDVVDRMGFVPQNPAAPAAISVGQGAMNTIFLTDLGLKVMIAPRGTAFITSDNPVVMTNPLFLGQWNGCVTGLNARGLVILFPVSPTSLVVLFDSLIYKIGPASKRIFEAQQNDINYANCLQYLNADKAVYFQDSAGAPSLVASFKKVHGLRRDQLTSTKRFGPVVTPRGTEEIIHQFNEDIRYAPPVSFLKPRDNVRHIPFGYRNELLRRLHAEFQEAVERGVFGPNQFAEFMEIDAKKLGIPI